MSKHGTKEDQKYASKLTDEELRNQFDSLDLNHNGVLDLDETTIAFQHLGIPAEIGQERWQKAMVKEFGSAKTQLNFQEFAQYIRHRDQEVSKLFDEMDINKDGFISRTELQHALKKHGYAHTPDALNQIFSALDLDQSGEIDAAEWKKILLLSPSQELEAMLSEWADVSAMGGSNIPVPPIKKHSTIEQAMKQIAIGTFAGSIAKTALAPLSRIKVIIQVAEKNQSMVTAVSNIYKEGGIKSFYRGNLANILKSGPETGAKLFIFDILKEKFACADGHLSGTNRFLAGGLSSIFSHAMMYPIDLVKIRLEATTHGTYSGIFDCARTIYMAEGFIPAFYRGLVPVCLSTFPSSGITLGMYNYLSDRMKQKYGEKAGAKHFALASTLAALVSEAVTYPLHLAKSRLATQGSPGIPKKYDGLVDFCKKVYTTDGVRGFYRGLAPAIIKHVPSVAITMTTYDVLKTYFGISKPSKHH